MAATQWTKLNPRWLFKQAAMSLLFLGFGIWGLYDAMILYPNRGVAYADFMRFNYLKEAKMQGGADWAEPSIADPQAEYEKLHKNLEGQKDTLARAKHDWLEALRVVHRLDPAHTQIAKPSEDHDVLAKRFTTTSGTAESPKKLESYDVPVQWIIFYAGTGIGLIMFGFAGVVARHRYGWNPETKTLTLPRSLGGSDLTLELCEDFDRRKWDKFLMFVKVSSAHPTLAGRELKFDLLRYVPLESWIVEMEHTKFPDRAKPQTPPDDGIVAPTAATP
jgi:hypothetical protein